MRPRSRSAHETATRLLSARFLEMWENVAASIGPALTAPCSTCRYHLQYCSDNENTILHAHRCCTLLPLLTEDFAQQTLRIFCSLHGRYILFVPVPGTQNRYLKKLTCFLIVSLLFQSAFLLHPVFSDSVRSPAWAVIEVTRIYAESVNLLHRSSVEHLQSWCWRPASRYRHSLTKSTLYKQSERLHIRPDILTSPHCRVDRSVKPNELGG